MKTLIACYFATWLFIPWILLSGKRPVSTLAWIWAVMLFPFVGPIAFLLFGVDRITRAYRKQRGGHRETCEIETVPLPSDKLRLFQGLAKLSEFPTTTVNEITLLPNASTFYPALQEAIENATHHIHVIFFIWDSDEYGVRFRDLLVAAVRRGVEVRLLLDRIGSQNTKEQFFRPLTDAGGKVEWFRTLNPLRRHFSLHLRNHRKLQVIDGKIAFVGGMNIGKMNTGENKSLGHWRDVQVKLEGRIVCSLQRVFAEDWYFASEERLEGEVYFTKESDTHKHAAQILIGGPDLNCDSMAEAYLAVLGHATRRVWIATGYFAPDERLLSALRLAALRGADVRLVVTQKSDHPYLAAIGQSYYDTLLAAGVRIFEYTKGINHAKTVLLDDDLLVVGSSNCDDRSMRLNFELSVLMRSAKAAQSLQDCFEEDFQVSEEVVLETFRKRSWKKKVVEAIFRPLSPMT